MKVNLYALTYNNKYNGFIKCLNDINDAAQYLIAENAIYNIANFNFGDGIYTTTIITKWIGNVNPDYVVLEDIDAPGIIHSRWFVVDATYQSNGTYFLTLERDSVADNINNVLNAKAYITKGYVNPYSTSNPVVYNSEAINVNEIKTAQYPLMNKAKCPWIVALLARTNNVGEPISYVVKTNIVETQAVENYEDLPQALRNLISLHNFDITPETLKSVNFVYQNYYDNGRSLNLQTKCLMRNTQTDAEANIRADLNEIERYPLPNKSPFTIDQRAFPMVFDVVNSVYVNQFVDGYNNVSRAYSKTYIDSFSNYVGKIYTVNGVKKILKYELVSDSNDTTTTVNNPAINQAFQTLYDSLQLNISDNPLYYNTVSYTTIRASFELVDVALGYESETTFKFNETVCTDSPYEILAMPYPNEPITWIDYQGKEYTHTKDKALAFMMELGKNTACYGYKIEPYIE